MQSALKTTSPLPQWYALMDGARIIGCAGLITNDFISRMDLWPWLCGLYVEKDCRGHGYGALLMERARARRPQSGLFPPVPVYRSRGLLRAVRLCVPCHGLSSLGRKVRIYEGKTE